MSKNLIKGSAPFVPVPSETEESIAEKFERGRVPNTGMRNS